MALHVNVYVLGAQGMANAITGSRGRPWMGRGGIVGGGGKVMGRPVEAPAFTNHGAFPAKDEIVP